MTTKESMRATPETPATVEQCKRRYRELVIAQRRLPLAEQWTMAEKIRDAKARCIVAVEALRYAQ